MYSKQPDMYIRCIEYCSFKRNRVEFEAKKVLLVFD